jgi:hypothetical protein
MQEVEYTEYDRVMKDLANEFQEALKKALAAPYPYAPGFGGSKTPSGLRNMKTKTGNLYKSIKVSFDDNNNEITVAMLDYWRYVNDGRRPGKYVPLKPLMQWIRNKGWNRDPKGRFKKFNVKSAAFGVSTNIMKFGIQPTYFYDKAFEIFEKKFQDEAVQALGIDITTFFQRVVEEDILKG